MANVQLGIKPVLRQGPGDGANPSKKVYQNISKDISVMNMKWDEMG